MCHVGLKPSSDEGQKSVPVPHSFEDGVVLEHLSVHGQDGLHLQMNGQLLNELMHASLGLLGVEI